METPGTKQTEDKLHLIEFMVDHAAEGIFMTSHEGQILYVNDSVCKTTGYSREELLLLSASDIDPYFKQDRLQEFRKRIRRQKVITVESVQITKLGTEIPAEVTINFLKYNGDELFVAFVKDISERKEEEHLKNISLTIFQSINRSTSLSQLILDVRNELSKILDSSSLKVIILNPLNNKPDQYSAKEGLILVKKVRLEGTLDAWMLKSNRPALLKEDDIKRLNEQGDIQLNKSTPRIWLGAPLFAGENVTGIISLESLEESDAFTEHHLDIIELVCSQISLAIQRRQTEEALKVSERNLRESNVSKDKFFSIIAHDLRGPFNAIIGFSDLLHTDFDSFNQTEQKTMIRSIHDASVSTLNLLENLLEWSRIQTGGSKPIPECADVSTIVNNCITLLKAQSEKKRIKLFSEIRFGTHALCDVNMITTVIRNLVSNAIKFTGGGGEIRLSVITRQKYLEIIVADTGVGIGTEDLKKLFRLDQSVRTGGTEGERGTGLGLILCREFVELNGGKIRAESTLGEGSKFRITLPRFGQ